MIKIFGNKNIEVCESLINYIKEKDSCINVGELKSAVFSNITSKHSYIFYSIDENERINGVLFGIEDEPACWLIQGFFFNSNDIALELSKYAYEYLNPKYIIYKKFYKNNAHIWNKTKIKKYLDIIN